MATEGERPVLDDARNLAGKIMLMCGVRGMSKEHGELQTRIAAILRSLQSQEPALKDPHKRVRVRMKDGTVGDMDAQESAPSTPKGDSIAKDFGEADLGLLPRLSERPVGDVLEMGSKDTAADLLDTKSQDRRGMAKQQVSAPSTPDQGKVKA